MADTPNSGWGVAPTAKQMAHIYYHEGVAVARIESKSQNDGWKAFAIARTGSSEQPLGKPVATEDDARKIVEDWVKDTHAKPQTPPKAGRPTPPAPAAQ